MFRKYRALRDGGMALDSDGTGRIDGRGPRLPYAEVERVDGSGDRLIVSGRAAVFHQSLEGENHCFLLPLLRDRLEAAGNPIDDWSLDQEDPAM